MSEVTEALRELAAETRTIEDVEQMFRTMAWPTPPPPPKDAAEAYRREAEDPRVPEGPAVELEQALIMGVIDLNTYERLAQAASEAAPDVESAEPAPDDESAEPAPDDEPAEGEPPSKAPPFGKADDQQK